ncbi:MAG TPA: aldolase/citrate lyase family protein, partial [Steroidobacteraceae bacterium]|nr:aldolase/citrate lyase family protein [Steroidobacteraceae bacterium]
MLFVPGDRPERFAKAEASGADAVILDLEDAVMPENRPRARTEIAAYLKASARAVPLWVRINPADSDDALADLSAVAASRPDGIMLPKA